MTRNISASFRAKAFWYLRQAAITRLHAIGATSRLRRERLIDARHFLSEARELAAAAAHSGWRLP